MNTKFDKNGLIWHYTSVENLVSFIDDDAHLYATHTRFVNDYDDGKYASETFIEYLYQQLAYEPGIAKLIPKLSARIRDGLGRLRFILCFSKKADDLSQWRAYAANGGFAIGFDMEELKNSLTYSKSDLVQFELKECEYINKKQEQILYDEIQREIDKFKVRSNVDISSKEVSRMLEIEIKKIHQDTMNALFYKSDAYKAEDEVRLALMYDGFSTARDVVIVGEKPRVPVKTNKPINKLIKKIYVSPQGNQKKNFILASLLANKYRLTIDIEKSSISYSIY